MHGFSTAVRRMRRHWRLHVLNAELDRAADELQSALAKGADGVVSNSTEPEVVPVLEAVRKPVVAIARRSPAFLPRRKGPVAYVCVDNDAVGRMGAAYLESLGPFRSLAFVGGTNSSYRAEAFRAALAGSRAEVRVYQPDVFRDADVGPFAAWLRALPRPAAVMAAQDAMALVVLDTAARAGLRVPRDLAVLGVDNDELLCETAEPPLASIAVDHVRLGELAADQMRRLLENPDASPPDRQAPARGVVERQSARPLATATALAERAAAYIRHNATKGVTAADVAAHLGASRSLVDRHFRRVTGESMLEMILRLRLESVKAKLRETSLPVGQIVASCGFRDANYAMHLFKARFGCSMREWRRLP